MSVKRFSKFEIITTAERLDEYLDKIKTDTAFDTETTGLDRDALLLGASFYDNVRPPVFVGTDYYFDEGISLNDMRAVCNNHFPRIRGIAHNAKYDLGVFKRLGFKDIDLVADTSAMVHVWDPDLLKKLETRVQADLGVSKPTYEEIIGIKWAKIDWNKHTKDGTITLRNMGKYACEDVFYTYRLFEHYDEKLDDSLWKLVNDIETPLAYVLRDMKDTGVRIDLQMLKEQEVKIGKGIKELEQSIYDSAGVVFNINSPKQKAEVLFDKLGYPVIGYTKSGTRSTDKGTMEALAERGYPIAVALEEHSKLSTLDGSFIRAIPRFMDDDGRLRCDFNALGTSTGRFSSSKPNLQNQPNNNDYPVRGAFVPAIDHLLAGADYSQIELRIMAHCAQDVKLMDAFWSGEDIHGRVSRDLGIPRKGAKVVNFGVLYGMGPEKLAYTLGISTKDAGEIINGYEITYKGFARWKKSTERFAETHGYIDNIFGRIRRLPDAKKPGNKRAYYGALRRAVNTVIQGSAADLMKIAMIKAARRFAEDKLGAKILLTVHDELLVEAPKIEIVSVYDALVYEMENAVKLSVPIIVDGKICDNWSQMKDDEYVNTGESLRSSLALDMLWV